MTQYEVTFIVDPVLSGDESKSAAKTYQEMISTNGGSIVNVDNIGLRSLAYAINKRTTGVYYCVEFQAPGAVIDDLELALRRDERIMRFLTVKLDKYGVKYNDDKRKGLIGRKREQVAEEIAEERSKADTVAATGPAPAAEPVPASKAAAATVPDALAKADDDLTRIEGIGPKIASLLMENGITTFTELAEAPTDRIKDILASGGSRFASHDPGTWAAQADLAASGQEEALKQLQDQLMGGREVSSADDAEPEA